MSSIESFSQKALLWGFNSNFLFPSNHAHVVELQNPDPSLDVNLIHQLERADFNPFISTQTSQHRAQKPLRAVARTVYMIAVISIVSPLGMLWHLGGVANYGVKSLILFGSYKWKWEKAAPSAQKTMLYAQSFFVDMYITLLNIPHFVAVKLIIGDLVSSSIRMRLISLFFSFLGAATLVAVYGALFFSKEGLKFMSLPLCYPKNKEMDLSLKFKSILFKNEWGLTGPNGKCLPFSTSDLETTNGGFLIELVLDCECKFIEQVCAFLKKYRIDVDPNVVLLHPWQIIEVLEKQQKNNELVCKLKTIRQQAGKIKEILYEIVYFYEQIRLRKLSSADIQSNLKIPEFFFKDLFKARLEALKNTERQETDIDYEWRSFYEKERQEVLSSTIELKHSNQQQLELGNAFLIKVKADPLIDPGALFECNLEDNFEVVRARYKKLAVVFHPDKYKKENENRVANALFKILSGAYRFLEEQYEISKLIVV